jgi:hypothetical protein
MFISSQFGARRRTFLVRNHQLVGRRLRLADRHLGGQITCYLIFDKFFVYLKYLLFDCILQQLVVLICRI